MTYQGRALYNLLQMNFKQNPAMDAEAWQVENYRELSQEELFQRLEKLEIFLSEENFLLYVDECDSPEDLADCLYLEEDFEKHEQVYLCVFELWRRLAPHKQSLSLFVDELDHLIERYEEGELEVEEDLQVALTSFQSILDDNIDEGGEAKEGYHFFSAFSCHDLEVFIYEYISHQIDAENDLYASELLDGFYPYIDNERWFDLLRARLVTATNLEEGRVMVDRLITSLKEEPELYLLFEVLHYLIHIEDTEQFQMAYLQALDAIETQEDLRELLTLTAEYFNASEKEKEETLVNEILEKQKGCDLQESVAKDAEPLQVLKELVTLSLA
ncbi:MAG: hypothetical protein KDK64_04925 [Chlamydiia bacterium]|nr:hypothetical protein [Chlamydiia bacterium]